MCSRIALSCLILTIPHHHHKPLLKAHTNNAQDNLLVGTLSLSNPRVLLTMNRHCQGPPANHHPVLQCSGLRHQDPEERGPLRLLQGYPDSVDRNRCLRKQSPIISPFSLILTGPPGQRSIWSFPRSPQTSGEAQQEEIRRQHSLLHAVLHGR